MLIPTLPKDWLIHTIEYNGYTGKKDGWGNPAYEPKIIIENVRYDETTVFSRDNTQSKIVANGIIFVDATHSNPIPDFKEESLILINGRELTLKKIVTCYYPNENRVHHYELEVI